MFLVVKRKDIDLTDFRKVFFFNGFRFVVVKLLKIKIMALYQNEGGDSGIRSYQILPTCIIITFSTNVSYEYTYQSVGSNNIETMKSLAIQGEGLNSFINKNVKFKYSRKL